MPTSGKIFGQSKPGANTNTDLFIVATNKEAQVAVFVNNQHATTDDQISVALVPSGESLADKHYIVKSSPLTASSCATFSGICLQSGAKMVVNSTNGTSAFTATGLEIA